MKVSKKLVEQRHAGENYLPLFVALSVAFSHFRCVWGDDDEEDFDESLIFEGEAPTPFFVVSTNTLLRDYYSIVQKRNNIEDGRLVQSIRRRRRKRRRRCFQDGSRCAPLLFSTIPIPVSPRMRCVKVRDESFIIIIIDRQCRLTTLCAPFFLPSSK